MRQLPFTLILAALTMMLMPLPATAMNDACNDWVDTKPYLNEFYQLEGPQLDNLVRNFNATQPSTDLHPQIVGYTWMTGWDLVQLLMFEDGCLVIDRPYPRLAIWGMMASYPAAKVSFDKSAATYAAVIDGIRAKEDAEFERRRKWRAESGLDVADEETGVATSDEINGPEFGEMD